MFCSVLSTAISGVEAVPVQVEADVSDGMPVFAMVGHITPQVKEAQDRVRTALRNTHIQMPPKRITINLSPGDLRKDGTRFDLPIAAAVLQALGRIPPEKLEGTMMIGELHLDGGIERVPGVLPSVMLAKELGCSRCVIPHGNLREGRAVGGMEVVGLRSLEELLAFCRNEYLPTEEEVRPQASEDYQMDFLDVQGMEAVKRAALIAAAGFHNLLLVGPPGSGKSMTARRMNTILPDLTDEERIEISKIYSIAGLLPKEEALMKNRPFRSPHHTVSAAALCGGGMIPRPGEVTLAHRGVLFLDELPEMQPSVLEMLRQPLEDHEITISRRGGTCSYPASFLLVAAMNPCPCGYYPDMKKCTCSPGDILRYQSRVSQALLDRIDLQCEVPALTYEELTQKKQAGASSARMRAQVMEAYERQKKRFRDSPYFFNSEVSAADLERYCGMSPEADRLLEAAFSRLHLSARGYHHVIRAARTIADLDGEEIISDAHVSEALSYRCGEGNYAFSP